MDNALYRKVSGVLDGLQARFGSTVRVHRMLVNISVTLLES